MHSRSPICVSRSLKYCPDNSLLSRTDHLQLPRSVAAEVHKGAVWLKPLSRWVKVEGCQRRVKGAESREQKQQAKAPWANNLNRPLGLRDDARLVHTASR